MKVGLSVALLVCFSEGLKVMRWVLAMLAWLVATAVLGPVSFFVVILVAGPHSSMLPSTIQPLVLITGLVVFFAVPVLVARSVWRRTTLPKSLG